MSPSDHLNPVVQAAYKLIEWNMAPESELDVQTLTIILDFVSGSKASRETGLPTLEKTTGAYYEYETSIPFFDYLQYNYTRSVPSVITSPSSQRFALWRTPLPDQWKPVGRGQAPVIIRGTERVGITPDLTTGVYYEYDLQRTLILLNYKGRQALISISKQLDVSDVGKKGFILGDDNDWTYLYTGETGSAMTGLGWVKSYIYDYFSVGVHMESQPGARQVRSGIFQWLRAGWSGVNFVQTGHVLAGMKRYAQDSKAILESATLPSPESIQKTYQKLSEMPLDELIRHYNALEQARYSLAVAAGKVSRNSKMTHTRETHPRRELMIEEIMLDLLKKELGKTALLSKSDTRLTLKESL